MLRARTVPAGSTRDRRHAQALAPGHRARAVSASPTRRRALRAIGAALAGAAAPAAAPAAAQAPGPANAGNVANDGNAADAANAAIARAPGSKVLRLVLPNNPVGLDPAGVADTTSASVVDALFDAPLRYDYLAQPAQLRPNTLAEMPEVSADFTRFVFRLQPGIHFADDPVFQGRPRELTAADCVYSVKRLFDPKVRSPNLFQFEAVRLLGMDALRRDALAGDRPFDYDREVPGLRALDRYRFEVRTQQPVPRLLHLFANVSLSGAVAREVVQAQGTDIAGHPVGTGPYRLVQWVRNQRLVLERNPKHRHRVWDETPDPSRPEDVALAARLRGRSLPMIDRVEFAIIEETQPRWLAFLAGDLDLMAIPFQFQTQAVPGGRLAPYLAARGVQLHRAPLAQTMYLQFNMDDPLVGGYAPQQVALRRAIALGYDTPRMIEILLNGQAVQAHSILAPGLSGRDDALRSDAVRYDPARARALLDLYGWVDRDGDGWRERPDGQPLVLEVGTGSTQSVRQINELWQRDMRAIGLRMRFDIKDSGELIKLSRNGRLMLRQTAWNAPTPDGTYFSGVLYGPNSGQSNHARFKLPAFDALHERQALMPDGPERTAVMREAMRLSLAYMPIVPLMHSVGVWLAQPRVVGYRPHVFTRAFFRYLDLDLDLKPAAA